MKYYETLKRFVLMALFIAGLCIPIALLAGVSSLAEAAPVAFDCTQVTQIPVSECEVLVTIYTEMGGDQWFSEYSLTGLDNWLKSYTPCHTWAGVDCLNGHVVGLSFSTPINTPSGVKYLYFGAYGALPASIKNLTYLKTLDLRENYVNSLPPEIGSLSNLEILDLYLNELTSLPATIGNLGNLRTLDLTGNKVTNLPVEIGNLIDKSS